MNLKNKGLLLIFSIVLIATSILYISRDKSPASVFTSKSTDSSTTTTRPEYVWPQSDSLKECLEASKGKERDIGEPCYFSGESYVYFSKATIDKVTYGVMDGWVWTKGIKTSGDKVSFSVDEEFGSSKELKEINNTFFNLNKIKLLEDNKEWDIVNVSQLSANELLNVRIYYTLPKTSYLDKFISWLFPEAMAKLWPNEQTDGSNIQTPIISNNIETDINYTIKRNDIFKIVFQKPTFDERVIDNHGQSGIMGLQGSYLRSVSKDNVTLIKFNNTKDWITVTFADESPYWALENLLAYAKNNTYIDFYCSKFNNSCMFVEQKTVWEFNFDFNGFDKEIIIPIKYQSEIGDSYKWESDTDIVFFDENRINYPISISKFISDNPKLQRKNNDEWTEKGFMSIDGNIYCGKLKDLLKGEELKCSLNVSSLSFK
jgi:hypothetical protein